MLTHSAAENLSSFISNFPRLVEWPGAELNRCSFIVSATLPVAWLFPGLAAAVSQRGRHRD